jgi:hypothetical protein
MKTLREIKEHIEKVSGGYRLVSKKTGKNLGTYPSKSGAEKRERQVQYFKHLHEMERKSSQARFEAGLKRGGYDVNARAKFWADKMKELKKQQADYEKERGELKKEDVAVNSAGAGNVAGIGVGKQGEPGIMPKKKNPFLKKLK